MIIRNVLISAVTKTQSIYCSKSGLLSRKQNVSLLLLASKLSSHHVSKNIEHILQDDPNGAIQCFDYNGNRPLLVLLSWLLAKRTHIMKYTDLYLEQGFDVLIVSSTPWQLLWPPKGTRLVAAELLDFLAQHQNYQQILLHGFSVGGYMWGEVLDLIQNDREKYHNIVDRVVGQVWDSAADVCEMSIGTPRAVFPKNEMLQNMLQKYLEYHLKAFYKQSTQYYIRSSQLFHSNLVRGPALFFLSKIDPVGTITSNLRVKENWEALGVKTYVKIFDKSPHVGHYRKYPKEYVAELYAFLDRLHLIKNEEKMRAHL